jgi:hypothetical protein
MIESDDWFKMLKENNINPKILDEYLKSKDFLLKAGKVIDDKNKSYVVAKSKISGKGIFAKKDFIIGNKIGFGLKDNNRTYLGRYVNHSPMCNAKFLFLKENNDSVLIAVKPINKDEEIVANYRDHTFNKEYYYGCK